MSKKRYKDPITPGTLVSIENVTIPSLKYLNGSVGTVVEMCADFGPFGERKYTVDVHGTPLFTFDFWEDELCVEGEVLPLEESTIPDALEISFTPQEVLCMISLLNEKADTGVETLYHPGTQTFIPLRDVLSKFLRKAIEAKLIEIPSCFKGII